MKKNPLFGGLVGCLLFAAAAHASPVLTLDPPSGAISGTPGTTIGWGFSLTNTTDYVVITGSQFCDASSSPLPDICLPVSPDLGSYADLAGLQFLVVGPSPESTTISQVFDASLLTGIGSFAIDPSASGTSSGIIVLTYDLFSVSPNDPTFSPDDEISGGNFLTAAASATVVPEPGSLVLLGAGLVAAGLHRKRVLGGGGW